MAPIGMAPFAKFRRQGSLLSRQRLGLQVLEALVHLVEGAVKPTVNGTPLGSEAVNLTHRHLLQLAGTQMQFIQN